METRALYRLLRHRGVTVAIISVAVGLLVSFQAFRERPKEGFEERVLVAIRDIPLGSNVQLQDFKAVPVSQIEPQPPKGAAVNDQQLHLVTHLKTGTAIPVRGLLLWGDLIKARETSPAPKQTKSRAAIEVIEEQ